jgi:hypothetical protein
MRGVSWRARRRRACCWVYGGADRAWSGVVLESAAELVCNHGFSDDVCDLCLVYNGWITDPDPRATRFGVDPAVLSAPLITTLVDATGLIIYFTIAKLILGL